MLLSANCAPILVPSKQRAEGECPIRGGRICAWVTTGKKFLDQGRFTLTLESMGKPPFSIGRIAPTPKLVDQFFNDSTGDGEYGEVDARGPWNEGGDWHFVESPAIAELNGSISDGGEVSPPMHAESSGPGGDSIKDLLIHQLRDILDAEKQLTKALPKMASSARSVQLQRLFRTHLEETEAQAERLGECLRMLGSAARAKPCKGMAGLIEEGEEVMKEARKRTMLRPISPLLEPRNALRTTK